MQQSLICNCVSCLLLSCCLAVGDQATGSLNSAIGQPRLLIPVVLALTYNRWNAIYADDYGVHLNFYGMLIGFFTYKLAVVGRQGLQLLSDLSAPQQQQAAAEGSSSSSGSADDAMSLDRIFVRKVMSE
jgi:ATP synthase protein I